jgi:hypothetical protein
MLNTDGINAEDTSTWDRIDKIRYVKKKCEEVPHMALE